MGGLVYVGAFIPDEGETLQNLADQSTDSKVLPALRPTQYPTTPGSAPDAEFIIDPASFHEIFCADLPTEQAAILAVSQRPLAGISFGEPTQNPAWKALPSWPAGGGRRRIPTSTSTGLHMGRTSANQALPLVAAGSDPGACPAAGGTGCAADHHGTRAKRHTPR